MTSFVTLLFPLFFLLPQKCRLTQGIFIKCRGKQAKRFSCDHATFSTKTWFQLVFLSLLSFTCNLCIRCAHYYCRPEPSDAKRFTGGISGIWEIAILFSDYTQQITLTEKALQRILQISMPSSTARSERTPQSSCAFRPFFFLSLTMDCSIRFFYIPVENNQWSRTCSHLSRAQDLDTSRWYHQQVPIFSCDATHFASQLGRRINIG